MNMIFGFKDFQLVRDIKCEQGRVSRTWLLPGLGPQDARRYSLLSNLHAGIQSHGGIQGI